jgi:hypothetical protein
MLAFVDELMNLRAVRLSELPTWLPTQRKLRQAARLNSLQNPVLPTSCGPYFT